MKTEPLPYPIEPAIVLPWSPTAVPLANQPPSIQIQANHRPSADPLLMKISMVTIVLTVKHVPPDPIKHVPPDDVASHP